MADQPETDLDALATQLNASPHASRAVVPASGRMEPWLRALGESAGSDLLLVAGEPPIIRVQGRLKRLDGPPSGRRRRRERRPAEPAAPRAARISDAPHHRRRISSRGPRSLPGQPAPRTRTRRHLAPTTPRSSNICSLQCQPRPADSTGHAARAGVRYLALARSCRLALADRRRGATSVASEPPGYAAATGESRQAEAMFRSEWTRDALELVPAGYFLE